jgi:hypothetical protein
MGIDLIDVTTITNEDECDGDNYKDDPKSI